MEKLEKLFDTKKGIILFYIIIAIISYFITLTIDKSNTSTGNANEAVTYYA